MNKDLFSITEGASPLVAAAIHDGHLVRDEVEKGLALSEHERLREEDPFTGIWTDVADTRVVANYSRFQVDLNRPREAAVYIRPEDAWGLPVWKDQPGASLVERSLQEYDLFYETVDRLLSKYVSQFGRVVVFDLHSYNHRREGPDGPPAVKDENPEINVGTGSMDRVLWAPVVDRFIKDLNAVDFLGRKLDVGENIKFRGGQFSRTVHQRFPGTVCVLSVEVKKFFMDEWTGKLDQTVFGAVHRALGLTVSGILEELRTIGVKK